LGRIRRIVGGNPRIIHGVDTVARRPAIGANKIKSWKELVGRTDDYQENWEHQL
jgi:hypothetical protein